jgi:inosine-uridine nucleoside N-ribohydrolase
LKKLPVDEIDETPIQRNILACDFIIDHCQKYPNEVSIVTIGPLTNIAVASQKFPELSNFVKEIICMGGSLNKRGNKSPTAEANILCDAESAKVVFNSNFNFTLIPLNLTENVTVTREYLEILKEHGEIGKFIHDTNQHYIEFLETLNLPIAVHDSMTIAYLLNPEIFDEPISVFVDVETKGELTYGMTVPDWRKQFGKKENLKVLLNASEEKFRKIYFDRVTKFIKELK